MNMDAPEFFAILGFPVRVLGRAPLVLRYLWGANANILLPSSYARERYGPSYKLRPWLLLDARDLEPLERLINEGSDDEVLDFRSAQLAIGSSTAVVVSIWLGLHSYRPGADRNPGIALSISRCYHAYVEFTQRC